MARNTQKTGDSEAFGVISCQNAALLKLNAYGMRWHVMVDGRGIVFSGRTKQACLAYGRRHGLRIGE